MPVTPNIFAWLALIVCIPICVRLFQRYPPPQACAIAIIGSFMFMPELLEFDPPLLPPFDKVTIPALGALIGAYFYGGRARLARARPFRGPDAWSAPC
jgi:hypothetical protein